MMKAVVLESYGSPEVLKVISIPVPSPKKNEVLVKIHATAVNTGDVRVRRADPFLIRLMYGLFKPGRTTIPGMEVSGTVVAVGEEVSDFQPGDEVFGSTGWRLGGYAQYRCFPDHGKLIRKPGNCSFEEAAAVTVGGNTALQPALDLPIVINSGCPLAANLNLNMTESGMPVAGKALGTGG